jgi:transposase
MANKTLKMEQIRNLLQQRLNGQSIRTISYQSGLSRNTVRTYLRRIEQTNQTLDQVLKLDDEALGLLIFESEAPAPTQDPRYVDLQVKLAYYSKEFKRRHMTRQLLWEEYLQELPDGYGFTRFCHYLNEYIEQKEVTAIFDHRPADKLMVDFAGDKLSYLDTSTGELIYCEVLVAALPYSSYIYAEALPDQSQQSFAQALANAFHYLGGVPQSVLCDNLKSAVKRPSRYEPTFNELIDQLSLHYQTTFMATRVRKPRDKATVEASVKTSYNRIYAKLRDVRVKDLKELNFYIKEALQALNKRNFKGRSYSREDLFLQYEKSCLRPLPTTDFEVKKVIYPKVARNYHIIVGEDWHLYSVPYRLVGKNVKVVYTSDWVEIYYDHKRVAIHRRNYRKNDHTTLPEHMPSNHQAIHEQKGWTPDYFLNQAGSIGPCTRQAVSQILNAKMFVEQTYRSCLGVIRLGNTYGKDRLEKACQLMLNGPRVNYRILDNILRNNMDKLSSKSNLDFKTPPHDNIRGPENYNT